MQKNYGNPRPRPELLVTATCMVTQFSHTYEFVVYDFVIYLFIFVSYPWKNRVLSFMWNNLFIQNQNKKSLSVVVLKILAVLP